MDTKPSVWEQEGKKKKKTGAWHHSLPHSAQALSGMGQPESLTANKPWKGLFFPSTYLIPLLSTNPQFYFKRVKINVFKILYLHDNKFN